jgi:hypothetical protein
MKLSVPSDVRLVTLKTITTKAGKEMIFATIANMTTFETLETRLILATGQTMADIAEGRNYKAVVEYDGTYGGVILTPVASAGFGAETATNPKSK